MPDNPRWKRRPPGSTWGDWGPDDQLGRLNLLTPDKVLKGVAEALGIENMAAHGVQGRGVMIDLERHCGTGESFIGYDQLMRIMEADKVTVEEGDLVCLRTGYDKIILGMNKNPDPAVLAAHP